MGAAGKPVGVMSVGCHTSTNKGLEKMQCEAKGSSFVTGFVGTYSSYQMENLMQNILSEHYLFWN